MHIPLILENSVSRGEGAAQNNARIVKCTSLNRTSSHVSLEMATSRDSGTDDSSIQGNYLTCFRDSE